MEAKREIYFKKIMKKDQTKENECPEKVQHCWGKGTGHTCKTISKECCFCGQAMKSKNELLGIAIWWVGLSLIFFFLVSQKVGFLIVVFSCGYLVGFWERKRE